MDDQGGPVAPVGFPGTADRSSTRGDPSPGRSRHRPAMRRRTVVGSHLASDAQAEYAERMCVMLVTSTC
jgi:hypothetical protein